MHEAGFAYEGGSLLPQSKGFADIRHSLSATGALETAIH
jgi:hypothetical protein